MCIRDSLTTLQVEAYLKAFEALASNMQVRIYGNGGQTTQIVTDLMSIGQGVRYLGEEMPFVERWLGANKSSAAGGFLAKLVDFMPFIRQVMGDVNPRMFTSLKVVDLLDRLTPVVAGREDLLTALNKLKEDAGFRVVGDIPVVPLLRLFGISLPEADASLAPMAETVSTVVSEAEDVQGEDDKRDVELAE